MSRIDKLDEIMDGYEGRKHYDEITIADTWETMRGVFDKDKLDELDEESREKVIEIYDMAVLASSLKRDPRYLDNIYDQINRLFTVYRYTNPHAVKTWYGLIKTWLDNVKL